jgi:hypothetical protein
MLEALAEAKVDYVLIGGTAAILGGATHLTFDVDITPARDRANLDRLALALGRLHARLVDVPEHLAAHFQLDGATLGAGSLWNFATDKGRLDVVLEPAGTGGYGDLRRNAKPTTIRGITVSVAALEDVIRSKEAAGRDRDRAVLPDLRRALELSLERQSRGGPTT